MCRGDDDEEVIGMTRLERTRGQADRTEVPEDAHNEPHNAGMYARERGFLSAWSSRAPLPPRAHLCPWYRSRLPLVDARLVDSAWAHLRSDGVGLIPTLRSVHSALGLCAWTFCRLDERLQVHIMCKVESLSSYQGICPGMMWTDNSLGVHRPGVRGYLVIDTHIDAHIDAHIDTDIDTPHWCPFVRTHYYTHI